MVKLNGKPKKRDALQPNRKDKKHIAKTNAYRKTTRELLKTFPDLPTGPSGHRRSSSDELSGTTKPDSELSRAQGAAMITEPISKEVEMDQIMDHDRKGEASDNDQAFLFSENSCVIDDEEHEMDDESPQLGKLPTNIWVKIFSMLHPMELARLRGSSKLFYGMLEKDSIWRASIKTHLPLLPKPILNISEPEMLNLLLGIRCMLCETTKGVRTYWPFRVRSCQECLSHNTKKEFMLQSGPDVYPQELLDSMLFGMVDVKDNWVTNPCNYRPNIGLTRLYWINDLESTREEYEQAKEMSAADEWLKGLDKERNLQLQEIERIEKWEASRPAHFNPEHTEFLQSMPMLSRGSSVTVVGDGTSMDELEEYLKQERTPRQKEIIDRCQKLEPPLPLNILVQLPIFRGSTGDGAPLDDEGWNKLRAKLFQEWQELKENRRRQQSSGTGPNLRNESDYERSANGNFARSALNQRVWESSESFVQSNRNKLAEHAEEIIRKYEGKITSETVPEFAAHVLRHCRKAFLADETTRRKRLTLEDMKFIYDFKLKPIAFSLRNEMFLCNGCPTNPRWWEFQSLVQHFTAKHTYNPRGRAAKVNWRADWPEIGPFRANPEKVILETPIGACLNGYEGGSFGDSREHREYREYRDYRKHHIEGIDHPVPTGPLRRSLATYPSKEDRREKISALATDAREAWFQLCNVEGMQSSVLMHFVITRTARKFQTRFQIAMPITLFMESLAEHPAMGIVKSANGLQCIECQKRARRIARNSSIKGGFGDDEMSMADPEMEITVPATKFVQKPGDEPFTKAEQEKYLLTKSERTFPISSLLQHFETIHIKRNKSIIAPDWTRDMVRLPHPKVISTLAMKAGYKSEAFGLFQDVFPWAFTKGGRPGWQDKEVDEEPRLWGGHKATYKGAHNKGFRRSYEHGPGEMEERIEQKEGGSLADRININGNGGLGERLERNSQSSQQATGANGTSGVTISPSSNAAANVTGDVSTPNGTAAGYPPISSDRLNQIQFTSPRAPSIDRPSPSSTKATPHAGYSQFDPATPTRDPRDPRAPVVRDPRDLAREHYLHRPSLEAYLHRPLPAEYQDARRPVPVDPYYRPDARYAPPPAGLRARSRSPTRDARHSQDPRDPRTHDPRDTWDREAAYRDRPAYPIYSPEARHAHLAYPPPPHGYPPYGYPPSYSDPRDPYARDSYARPVTSGSPDPYARPPVGDPYARSGTASQDPRDPYARPPTGDTRDPRDPYARPMPARGYPGYPPPPPLAMPQGPHEYYYDGPARDPAGRGYPPPPSLGQEGYYRRY
ncbi:hypothetical protein BZA77DRAFT_58241 [Pyronema omphalodes]|nr:hypothetical protein BZA77DRAFT_58241 [Pyronema omphalodes]